ncbi:MAG: hypothetical protein LHW41_05595 [Candidatus Cloacimonetes bacterium]|nr:hypothetical protein [Candidatus Cloacimonadota bacterium]
MIKISVKCSIQMLEDFHIGTGVGNVGLYDDSQYKDMKGVNIRESSFKGVLRDSCRQVIKYHKEFSDDKAVVYENLYRRMFHTHSDLHSLDISITPASDVADKTIIHYFTAVDPKTGIAQNNSLRSIEFGAKSLRYEIKLSYLCPGKTEDNDAKQIKEYIIDALRNMKCLGGYRRRGFGAFEICSLTSSINKINSDDMSVYEGNKIRLILQLKEDTLISAKAQSGNLLETNDYIPGTTILGMFRAKLLSMGIDKSYLDDDAILASFFYPLPPETLVEADYKVTPVFISMRRKKEYLKPDQKHEHIPIWALSTQQEKSLLRDIISHNILRTDLVHSDPSKGMYEGYLCVQARDNGSEWEEAKFYKVNKRIYQRNRIDASTQSTKEDGVFIESRIEKDTCFMGYLTFKNEALCAEFCKDFSAWLSGKNNLHVGRGGKPCVIKSFRALQDNDASKSVSVEKDSFNLSFISDAILFDDKLRPITQFNEEVLADLLTDDFTKNDFTLERHAQRLGIVSSFSGTTGLRKFRDIAIRKGSCFSFSLNDVANPKIEKLMKELQRLETFGIGIRKHEGFGCIAVNHPVHDVNIKHSGRSETASMLTEIKPNIPVRECVRLSKQASVYIGAEGLYEKLNKDLKELIKNNTIVKCKSFVSKIIGLISENPSMEDLKKKIITIRDEKSDDTNTQGIWSDEDFRMMIVKLIINNDYESKSVEIALKWLLLRLGGNNE